MDTYTIDIELEHYYGDRMAAGSREAVRRFYLRAVSRFGTTDLERYFAKVRAHAEAYSSLSHMFRSPFTHAETPLMLSSLVLLVSSVVMVASGETSVLVAGGTSAGLIGVMQCARKLLHYWQENAVREAVFQEFAELLMEEAGR